MRTTKLGAALASLAITTGTAAVLAAGQAQADTTATTHSSLALGGRSGVAAVYGSDLGTFSATVTYDDIADGTTPPVTAGSADLQQKLPGHDWKTVRTDANASDGVSFGSYGRWARQNVKYRLHYLGGTDVDTATTYAESYSGPVVVRTAWNLNPHALCTHKCRFYGRLAPRAKHHKVVIQVKHHGWKRYKVVRTNKHSHWTVVVKPKRGKGALYRAVVAGNKHLIKNYALGRFTIIGKSSYSVSQR